MASNYDESTQRRFWLFEQKDLDRMRLKLECNHSAQYQWQYPTPGPLEFSIFIALRMGQFSKLLEIPLRPYATAQVYIRRFYIKVHPRYTNPYLVLTTAIYLACKVEEHHKSIRSVATAAGKLWPQAFLPSLVTATHEQWLAEIDTRIGDCEFWMITELSGHLVVHHPYEALYAIKSKFKVSQFSMLLAHRAVHDALVTDVCLLYPPYIIGATAAAVAVACLTSDIGNGTASDIDEFATAGQQSSQVSAQEQASQTQSQQQQRSYLNVPDCAPGERLTRGSYYGMQSHNNGDELSAGGQSSQSSRRNVTPGDWGSEASGSAMPPLEATVASFDNITFNMAQRSSHGAGSGVPTTAGTSAANYAGLLPYDSLQKMQDWKTQYVLSATSSFPAQCAEQQRQALPCRVDIHNDVFLATTEQPGVGRPPLNMPPSTAEYPAGAMCRCNMADGLPSERRDVPPAESLANLQQAAAGGMPSEAATASSLRALTDYFSRLPKQEQDMLDACPKSLLALYSARETYDDQAMQKMVDEWMELRQLNR